MINLTNIIRYPLSVGKQVLLLPKHAHHTMRNSEESSYLKDRISEISADLSELKIQLTEKDRIISSIDDRLATISTNLTRSNDTQKNSKVSEKINNTVADNHNLDHFYKNFEDKFRGSEDSIKIRVSEYLSLFNGLDKSLKNKEIIDLGCGRGEFLSFAKDNNLNSIGVDMNKSMVERANKLGFTAVENDAISYLSELKQNSLAAVTGFHIVEHIPFESLIMLFEECYRTIDRGGFALFETPNPENLAIGACNFYMDPSHIKPIPPELLAFALDSVGFKSEIIRTHPVMDTIEHEDSTVKDIMGMVYGPRDYAVVARKP